MFSVYSNIMIKYLYNYFFVAIYSFRNERRLQLQQSQLKDFFFSDYYYNYYNYYLWGGGIFWLTCLFNV